MPNGNIIAVTAFALLLLAPAAGRAVAESAEDAIRTTFAQWTKDFNARQRRRRLPPVLAGAALRFSRLSGARLQRRVHVAAPLAGRQSKRYVYALDIREIIVSGDLAVVRLAWTLTVTLPNGQIVTSVEPGMDVLRKSPDGQWKIIRYIAYEAPERPLDGGP